MRSSVHVPPGEEDPTATTLLDSWLAFSRAHPTLQQFGQADDESTFNGGTGCTHTCLQRLVMAKTGTRYSHDQISTIATYPWPAQNPNRRGLYSGGSDNEVGKVMSHFGLTYRLVWESSWAQIMAATRFGPALIGIRYGWWPEQPGYSYQGRRADGKPGGFAYRNGKTQLAGFEQGYHAILLLGQQVIAGGYRTYANEPNHGSSSRPEHPDYDSVRSSYAARAYDMYGSTGRRRFAWLPTTTLRPKGF